MGAAISTGFVGRSDELGRLLIALERAEQGRPVMVLVAGDAGIGKTRLLAELADRARQLRTLHHQAIESAMVAGAMALRR